MNMTGHCPRCNSTLYTPDPGFGGAGRNKCLECNHIGPVADFHPEPVLTFIPFYDANIAIANAVTRTAQDILDQALETPTIRNSELARSAGFGMVKNAVSKWPDIVTSKAKLHTEKPPAPIRQYKDDTEE